MQHLRGGFHLGQGTHRSHRVGVGNEHLTLYGRNLKIRIKVAKHGGHEIVKSIEDGQHTDQRDGGHSHAANRNHRNDVDGVVRLLSQQIAPGDEER